MKTCLRLPLLLALAALLAPALRAADSTAAALRAADDERVAAILAAGAASADAPARLTAIFSDELRYAHSSGTVDTKASYINTLVHRLTVYEAFEYQEREFKLVAPGVAVMTGRAHVKSHSADNANDMILSFLAVWREESGQWRFRAWQSCRLIPPTPAPARK